MDVLGVIRLTLGGAGMGGGLVLVWRFLLLLVSIDTDKPRAITRRNRSAPRYASSTKRRP